MQKGKSLMQLEAIVKESCDAIIGETLGGVISSWNGGAEKMFGYSAKEAIGKKASFLFPAEIKGDVAALMKKVKKGEVIADYDSVRIKKDGSRIDVALSVSPIHDEKRKIIGASVVERDITGRKLDVAHILRMKQLYSALSKCNKAVVNCKSENELFKEVCNAAVKFGGMKMAWVGLVDEKSKKVNPAASFGAGVEYLKGINISVSADEPHGRGPTGISIRENHPVWCQDFKNDPMTKAWHKRAENVGWNSSAALPLLRDGVAVGGLSLYSDKLNAFDDEAKKLLVEMAADISFALDNFVNKAKQKKQEEALLQIQTVVENSRDGIFGTTPKGVILNWNYGAKKMFGYSAEEVIGTSAIHLFSPEKVGDLPILVAKVNNNEFISNYETVVVNKTGFKIDVSLSISPIFSKSGDVIGTSVVVRDVTEKKKMEKELVKLKKAVDSSGEAIYMTDHEGTITFVNPGFTALYGYRDIEVISKVTPRILKSGVTKAEEYREFWKKILSKQKTNVERTNKTRDGRLVSVEGSVNPILDENDGISGFLAIQRDVTERKIAEQHINELNEVRSKFIDIISHQLGTPLTAVNWNLEQVLGGNFGKLEDTTLKFLQGTYGSSMEITHRIHDLLRAMDIEEGRVIFRKEEVDISNIATTVVNEMAKKYENKNISCKLVDSDKTIPIIEGDGEKIRIIIAKLVENAFTYTKENGKITIKLSKNKDVVRFEISDTGVGIPAPEQHYIFSRFFRASNASVMQPDSFGLGLFIANSFVRQHGGTIGFESKEGKGSIFWFEIPIKSPAVKK